MLFTMSQQTKTEMLHRFRQQYQQCSHRKEKRSLISTVMQAIGYQSRKSVIRALLKDNIRIKTETRGRKKTLTHREVTILKKLWFIMDQPCGKRMQPMIPEWIGPWEKQHGPIPEESRQHILNLSSASIDRTLKAFKTESLANKRQGSLSSLKAQIPIIDTTQKIEQCGHLYADTVAHGGNSTSGDFIWTLTVSDGYTQWTCTRALWNKGQYALCRGLGSILRELPFRLRSINTDNGSEFINYHMQSYFKDHHKSCRVTRSRPYRKNDNALAEEKNRHKVRDLVGYARFDDERLVRKLNKVYKWANLLSNHFNATSKLIGKWRQGARFIKRYDKAAPPYQRVLETMPPGVRRDRFEEAHNKLNPLEIREKLEIALADFYHLLAEINQEKGGDLPPSPLGKVRPCMRELA